ncbi:transcriptional regulator, AraC family [Mycolicibacterium canariasense]|uniref:Transcriptional regulator, AraC family n=1 Tax=Mycolicibacterium canariasense TaxID=228230 RepID=A0A117ICE1_MYCCR|nr:AraC family transcriptional regulator [Mycolicibacterium canariasense]MCV7207422.1 AraC family transcriptional regulator [Mycolicibacterium canariasense]GAS99317.1 transcriptional regulator, AraC family [Mycolicibacterium canariasense]
MIEVTRLVAELGRSTGRPGTEVSAWPGLTIERFTRPMPPRWNEIQPLSFGLIAGEISGHDAVSYAVLGGRREVLSGVLDAAPTRPVFCLLLPIDPHLVRSTLSSMRRPASIPGPASDVCAADPEVVNSVVRFLRALVSVDDRRVLAPLHLQELVYRLLQGQQRARMVNLAVAQSVTNPMGSILDYIADHLTDPLTVDTLAAQVCLSPSAFSRGFRELTGRSPYRYVKEKRLDRARQLLEEGQSGVAVVSREVGYSSVSHFIKEFQSRFGDTPGRYSSTAACGWIDAAS